jgi:hypothetical protein
MNRHCPIVSITEIVDTIFVSIIAGQSDSSKNR